MLRDKTCRVQNPEITRAGRGGAAHGRAGGDVDGSATGGVGGAGICGPAVEGAA